MSQLPSYLSNPSANKSFDEVTDAYYLHCLEQELAKLSPPVTLEQFRAKTFPKEVKAKLTQYALHEVIRLQGEGSELIERSMIRNIVAVARKHGQVHDRDSNGKELEDDSILNFLERKLEHVKSEGTRSEIKFFVELCVSLYAQGKGAEVEAMMRNRENFTKLLKGTKPIRDMTNMVVAASQRFNEQLDAKRRLSLELLGQANAESDESLREQILARRETLKTEIKDIEQRKVEAVSELQEQVSEMLFTATIMAQMPEVTANPSKANPDGIKQLLYKGVKVKHPTKLITDEHGNQVEVEDEERWVLDYPTGHQASGDHILGKMAVQKMFVNGHVAYVVECNVHDTDMVERSIGTWAEIQDSDPLNGIEDLIAHSEMEVVIWKRLSKKLEEKKKQKQAEVIRKADT